MLKSVNQLRVLRMFRTSWGASWGLSWGGASGGLWGPLEASGKIWVREGEFLQFNSLITKRSFLKENEVKFKLLLFSIFISCKFVLSRFAYFIL